MTSLSQYIGGLALCLVLSLVYTLARIREPRRVVRHTLLVFVYTLGVISAIALVVLLACKFK